MVRLSVFTLIIVAQIFEKEKLKSLFYYNICVSQKSVQLLKHGLQKGAPGAASGFRVRKVKDNLAVPGEHIEDGLGFLVEFSRL